MSDPIARAYLSAPDRPELPALTGLRAIAAAVVTGWHASHMTGKPLFPFNHGYLGVDLFFILSGFIIAYVYWSDFAPGAGLRPYGRFMALRLARLWPAHAAVLLLWLALWMIVEVRRDVAMPAELWWEAAMQVLLVHNWGTVPGVEINTPSWSISAEFLAYLLFPLYVMLFTRLRSTAALVGSIVVAIGALAAVGMLLQLPLFDPGLPANLRVLCEFAAGVALFRLWQGGQAQPAWLKILAWLALAGVAALTAFTPPRLAADFPIILLLAPIILHLAYGAGALARLLASRPMVYLGEISYSTYLSHWLVIGLMDRFLRRFEAGPGQNDIAGWSFLLLTVALSFAAGALLFHVVEKPARLWLRRRIDRPQPAQTMPT